jgi:Flp pilus assembly protein TadG
MTAHHKLRDEDGAAAVEFAIVASLLFVLIFGIMEFGIAFFQLQNLRSSAREGARVAAVGGNRTEIRDALVGGASGSIPSGYSTGAYSVSVNGATTGADQPCDEDAQGNEVRITIPVSSLPDSVQSAFSVTIPFLPAMTLTPSIQGSFRCE